MRLTLICVGRAKPGAERDLATRYIDRAKAAGRQLGLVVDVVELDESRARRPEDRKVDEARAILAVAGAGRLVALDETGRAVDSVAFAAIIDAARDQGVPSISLVIGGPDGLDPTLRRDATATIAFGAMTWPHQLARIMAAEQLYRAVTILSGHPYHRA